MSCIIVLVMVFFMTFMFCQAVFNSGSELTGKKIHSGFPPGFFQGGTKSIVIEIYIVMLIFLFFSDQILGGQKSFQGVGQTASGGGPNCFRELPLSPYGRKPVFVYILFSYRRDVISSNPVLETRSSSRGLKVEAVHSILRCRSV